MQLFLDAQASRSSGRLLWQKTTTIDSIQSVERVMTLHIPMKSVQKQRVVEAKRPSSTANPAV